MNVLQESFNDFHVLAFPCNQFGKQEPAANAEELMNGVKYVRPGNGFVPNFTMFKKIDVNGEEEHPLYTYLKSFCPATRQKFSDTNNLYYNPLRNDDVRWNWEKFLITKSGKPFQRYDPGTKPDEIRDDVLYLLQREY